MTDKARRPTPAGIAARLDKLTALLEERMPLEYLDGPAVRAEMGWSNTTFHRRRTSGEFPLPDGTDGQSQLWTRATVERFKRTCSTPTTREPLMTDATPLLDERQVAEWLGVSVRTMQAWRLRGGGPPFVKLGAAVRYAPKDVREFVGPARRRNTSDDAINGFSD